MATKKDKHEAAVKAREEFLEQERLHGLKVLEHSRRKREHRARQRWEQLHKKDHTTRLNSECPVCQEKQQAEARAAIRRMAETNRTQSLELAGVDLCEGIDMTRSETS